MEPAQILLIEDNPADVLLVQLALDEGEIRHTLLAFTSGVEAVKQLCGPAARAFAPDAILMDLNTPCSDGFEVLDKLQQRFGLVPIAILTSSRAQSDKRRATKRGVRYMEKPSDLDTFLQTVGGTVRDMLGLGGGQASLAHASRGPST